MFDQNITDLKSLQQKSLESNVRQDSLFILPTWKTLVYELSPLYHAEWNKNDAAVLVMEPLNMIIVQQLHKLKDMSISLKNIHTLDSFKAIDIDRIMDIFEHTEAVII